MPTVLITEPILPVAVAALEEKGFTAIKLYEAEPPNPGDVVAAIVRMGFITGEWMNRWPALRVIAYHGVGTDDIDLAAAKARGITVTTTPGQNALSVAEHTLALMLSLIKRLPEVTGGYRDRGFQAKYDYTYGELQGRTLGLIGLGDIGLKVARMAHMGFGMRVLAYDPHVSAPPAGIALTTDRMAVFRQGDFVSLHLPFTPQTAQTVGRAELSAMKPTAFLINCARGGIVDQDALIEALQTGAIAGAGLDVTDPEPCPPESPLLHMPNVILTPHTAASAEEAMARVALMCVDNIAALLSGKEPPGRVVV